MRRREFMTLLGGAPAAWPIAARAQQPERMRRVVVLSGTAETDLEIQARNAAFVQTLHQLGWTDRRNLRIDCHWINSDRRRDRPMIADLEGPSFISRTVAHRRYSRRRS